MRKKSLFSQTFTYLFISILLVIIILSTIFFFSIRRSVAIWNVNRGQRLESLILPLLTQVYRQTGVLEEVNIHKTLSPFLTSNVFAYVFDTDQSPIYIYYQGGRVPLYNDGEIRSSLRRLEDRNRPLTPIVEGGNVVGYLAADTLGFSHDVANRRFLRSVFNFMSWGIGIGVVVAAISAFIFSKLLSVQAKTLARELQRLTQGERGVNFSSARSEEMDAIAETAGRLQSRLQEEEQLRRQWAEDVAHDLRTPVSALKVQIEGMADGVFSADRQRLHMISKETERIEFLIQDLRELNNVESPEMNIKRVPVSLEPLLQEAISQFIDKEKYEEHRFRLERQIEETRADRHYLYRALTNVLSNALIHGSSEGEIHIAAYRKQNYVYFDISNPGKIDEENAKRFFDRLYKENSSRSDIGTGLGLPITRAIMRLHDGDAEIHQEGDRTHVYLSLYDPQ